MQAEASQQSRAWQTLQQHAFPGAGGVGGSSPCLYEMQAYSKFSFNDVIDASLLSATSWFCMKLHLVENQAFLTSPEGIFSLCANSPFMQREFCGFLADTGGKHLSEHHSLPAKFRAMCRMSAQPALGNRWLLCKLCWDPFLG